MVAIQRKPKPGRGALAVRLAVARRRHNAASCLERRLPKLTSHLVVAHVRHAPVAITSATCVAIEGCTRLLAANLMRARSKKPLSYFLSAPTTAASVAIEVNAITVRRQYIC